MLTNSQIFLKFWKRFSSFLVQWLVTLHDPLTVGPVQGQQPVLFGWDEGQFFAALLSLLPFKTPALATHYQLCMQVSKPSQEAYQNELNIESVERSFTLSARWRSHFILGLLKIMCHFQSLICLKAVECSMDVLSHFFFLFCASVLRLRETSGWRPSPQL